MIPPGSTLGLLGGGQLGGMFTAAAVQMGYQVVVADPDPHAPAARLAVQHLRADWNDPAIIDGLRQHVAAVTTEFENVPADLLRALAAHLPVRPDAEALAICQDRVREKSFLRSAGVATARWAAVTCPTDLATAWEAIGSRRAILKTSRLGYDGKGQAVVTSPEELPTAWRALDHVPCILEELVDLAAEVSVMVARTADDAVTTWDVGENSHVNGILHTTVVPARVPAAMADAARQTAIRIAGTLGYVGVLGVECFVTAGGELLVNELAPRPHNSGHWTIDASVTSQFEQQVRALADLTLGETRLLSPVAMVNILGECWRAEPPQFARALALPGVRLHLYGKKEPRPGRKMGHLTALGPTPDAALATALEAWALLVP